MDKEPTDEQRFDIGAAIVRESAESLLTEFYGERCPDFEPGCLCCQKWAALDSLLANPLTDDIPLTQSETIRVRFLPPTPLKPSNITRTIDVEIDQ